MNTSDLFRKWMRTTAAGLLLFIVGLLTAGHANHAAAQAPKGNFDHLKTGFALTGSHTALKCESCHMNGVFKGTPRDCKTCHTTGSRLSRANVVLPSNHIPVTASQTCESCHGTQSFTGAKFSHTGVAKGTCQTCHDGVRATGKSANHVATSAACDTCHTSTSAWTGAKPDHSGFTAATNCASCHNGASASGKLATHIPTSANCTTCHTVNGWKPSLWNHTQSSVTGACSTCHSGTYPPADGKSSNHIPYTALAGVTNCDTCHKGSYTAWNNGKLHANVNVTSKCETCHLTNAYGTTAKSTSAIHNGVTGGCESCHNTSAWAGAKVDHSKFTSATQCASCHDGSTATGKTATHIPTTVNCFSCHSVTAWKPTSWNHTQTTVAGACSTCHSGTYPPADGKTANHIPYTALAGVTNCDTCHKGSYTAWNNGKLHANVNVTSKCETCHLTNAYGTTAKSTSAIHNGVTGGCESCHNTSAWTGAKVDHSKFTAATQCATCHNGSTATGKTAAHIPTTVNCFSCHSVTAWKPTSWNHTQVAVAGACSTCHSGTYPPADGKTANHIPYTALAGVTNCDTCHKGSYTAWNNGKLHANVTVTNKCETCHLTSAYGTTAKPNSAVHTNVTGGCEACHNTSSWAGATVDHSKFTAATQCATCHNGSAATGKTATHIPVTANCISCHNVTGWKPTTWNHTQVAVTGACSTCHSGSYPPADGKTSNHIPYTGIAGATNCDSCHKGSYTAWNNGKFHANITVTSKCETCHLTSAYGQTAKSTSVIHNGVTGGCESCHNTSAWAGATVDHSKFTAATQCATCHNGSAATGKTATHIPVTANCFSCHNVTGWKPTKWNHTQVAVAGACSTCHSGAYPPADGRPANHIPYSTLTGTAIANCDSCHKGGYTAWNPGRFHANVAISSQCATCHLTAAYGLTAKPATPTHANVTGGCEKCHNTTGWAGAKVDHSAFTSATQCATCHNGSNATGKTATHIPVTANCFSCHNVTGWTPTKWNHTQVAVAGACSTCHSGAYPPADGRPTNHIPYTTLTGTAIANCDSCHKGGYASWNPGRFHANVAIVGQCATCHLTSAYGLTAKPATAIHTNVTGNCEKCHNTTGWAGAKVDHSAFTSATQCATCHNGSDATGKTSTHIPVTANCFSCHNVTGWTPTKWNHTQVPVTGACSTCHSGAYPPADGRPTNHIPYTTLTGTAIANCDSCHKAGYAAWNPGRFHANVSIVGQCATCHLTSAYGLTAKPATAIHSNVTGNCEKCHNTSGWAGAKVDHSTFTSATQCATCHNGSAATGKPSTHIPVTANCFSCHNVTGWTPTKWNHTQVTVTGACSTCHSGAYPPADGRPTNHIPYQAITGAAITNCDSCHKSGYAAWNPGRFHANVTISTQCATCHLTTAYGLTAKPGNAIHSTVTGTCENCHKSPTSWTNVQYTHATANAVGTGTCDNCHNGTTATGKPSTHIPLTGSTAKCDGCHKSQVAWATSMTMNHTLVTAMTCKTCHNGSYVASGATAKPNNHIPEAQLLSGSTMDCKACHTSTNAGGFTTMTMNHNNSQGNGSGWCYTCHQSGSAYLGNMQKKSLTHQKKTGVTDCSQSGCHRPLGNQGTVYRSW